MNYYDSILGDLNEHNAAEKIKLLFDYQKNDTFSTAEKYKLDPNDPEIFKTGLLMYGSLQNLEAVTNQKELIRHLITECVSNYITFKTALNSIYSFSSKNIKNIVKDSNSPSNLLFSNEKSQNIWLATTSDKIQKEVDSAKKALKNQTDAHVDVLTNLCSVATSWTAIDSSDPTLNKICVDYVRSISADTLTAMSRDYEQKISDLIAYGGKSCANISSRKRITPEKSGCYLM